MFKIVKRNEKGFTLIELMIVIAIIGVLAAIAIPQFAAYRARSFNSAAQSDVKNFLVTEATHFQDNQQFGHSTDGGPGAAAAICTGPATDQYVVSDGAASGLQFGLSNNVVLEGVIDANGTAFNVTAKHTQGTTSYASDSDVTVIYQDNTVGTGNAPAACIAAVAQADEFNGVGNWTAL